MQTVLAGQVSFLVRQVIFHSHLPNGQGLSQVRRRPAKSEKNTLEHQSYLSKGQAGSFFELALRFTILSGCNT